MNISEYTFDNGFSLEEAYLASTTTICSQCNQQFDDVDNTYAIYQYGSCMTCTDMILRDQLENSDELEEILD
jgi:hypothetical protein